ncbi:hypothetical protein CG419_03725 [Latilactobacillus curvatus]|uniref:DUF3800 domain-containing protein n=1 Tax=Latilactobacillus curvatus TaxID=28038 RepID=A0AAC9UNN8_LATCU|nr:DUF3800 domain-containing protein [Latilactobacillus curvatus]ASN59786.1 hypothetical protein CG419_03725 [Latilactobacillus curvatus]
MSILYIDECGTSTLKTTKSTIEDGNSDYFIMSGILIETEEMENMYWSYRKLKEDFLEDDLIELKSSLKKIKFCDEKLKSNDRRQLKNELKTEVYNLISNSNCKIFGAQFDKIKMCNTEKIKTKDDVYRLCFETLLEGLVSYINSNEIDSKIIVMIDGMGKDHNKKIYKAYRDALASKKEVLKNFNEKRFSPTINFVDSEFTFGCQLADFVAGAFWRGLERNEKKFSKLLIPRLPKGQNGEFINFSYRICK